MLLRADIYNTNLITDLQCKIVDIETLKGFCAMVSSLDIRDFEGETVYGYNMYYTIGKIDGLIYKRLFTTILLKDVISLYNFLERELHSIDYFTSVEVNNPVCLSIEHIRPMLEEKDVNRKKNYLTSYPCYYIN